MFTVGWACSGSPTASGTTAPPSTAAPPPTEAASAQPAATARAHGAADAGAGRPIDGDPGPAEPGPRTDFPPPPFEAMHERTAQPTDGRWQPYPEGTAPDDAVLFRSEVHPHPYKRYVFTIAIAADLSRLELHLVAGTDEPKSDALSKEARPGLIPERDHAALVAVFNGGFMERHGGHGMMLDGVELVPPRAERCTVALYRDGRVRVRSWEALSAELGAMHSYRQSSPCLIEQGELHPELPREHINRKWGGAEDGNREVRRSAVCLDKTGQTLIYGYGDYILAAELAAALQRAGAWDCAQMDINWSYTRFFPIDHSTVPPTLGPTFVEKLEYNKASYITKPNWKDFFYLRRRR